MRHLLLAVMIVAGLVPLLYAVKAEREQVSNSPQDAGTARTHEECVQRCADRFQECPSDCSLRNGCRDSCLKEQQICLLACPQ